MHPIVELRKLNQLEKKLVNRLLRERDPITQREMMSGLPDAPSQPTVSRAVQGLVKKGIIEAQGQTRGSRFKLSDQARAFATSPSVRKPVEFDPERISLYGANVTRWLSDDARDMMVSAAGGRETYLDASTYSQRIAERFLIDLSWASSRLEGNTYDWLDTEVLLKHGQEAEGHDHMEAVMLLNHKRAITQMLEGIGSGLPEVSDLMRWHAQMMNGLMDPSDLGTIRSHSVRISSSAYRPADNRTVLASHQAEIIETARMIEDPFEEAFFLLASTSYLQAFGDGNKRMGRLLANAALLESGLPPLSFVEIDQRSYVLGLVAFYETGDTSLLSETIAGSYVKTAPSYTDQVSHQRMPKRIESRETDGIRAAIQTAVRRNLEPTDVPALVPTVFPHLGTDEQEQLATLITERLAGLNPAHSVIYDLQEEEIEAWLGRELRSGLKS